MRPLNRGDQKYGIAGRVWEASKALKSYIEGDSDLEFDPPFLREDCTELVLLELGSGTGVVASTLAERLADTKYTLFVTDLPDFIRHTTEPSPSESTGRVLVRPLAWGNNEHAWKISEELSYLCAHDHYLTHIICSDLVYFPELLAPLLRSLIHVTSPPLAPPHGSDRLPEVIISYKIRSLAKETAFWSAFGLWFSFEPVLIRSRRPTEDGPQVGDGDNRPLDVWTRFGASGDGDMFVFVARRRPESLAWEIPSGDKELLEGVGAQGSSTRKGDDTFERLLLMQLEP
ncbi:hypothetical protein BC629DRAFT_1723743 [Irpex lacteus]|nr:hypothetical protein BC629DRAFT_1723743 [Irpex lacteus]